MKEIYKEIIGYEGYFEISNLGNVRSVTRRVPRGDNYNTYYSKPVATWKTRKGYVRCTLNKNKVKKNHLIHRLVAEAFIPNADSTKNQVNHKNFIKEDNKVLNLEWVDNSENFAHGVKGKRYKFQRYGIQT